MFISYIISSNIRHKITSNLVDYDHLIHQNTLSLNTIQYAFYVTIRPTYVSNTMGYLQKNKLSVSESESLIFKR